MNRLIWNSPYNGTTMVASLQEVVTLPESVVNLSDFAVSGLNGVGVGVVVGPRL